VESEIFLVSSLSSQGFADLVFPLLSFQGFADLVFPSVSSLSSQGSAYMVFPSVFAGQYVVMNCSLFCADLVTQVSFFPND
jgi:hypothetical protein